MELGFGWWVRVRVRVRVRVVPEYDCGGGLGLRLEHDRVHAFDNQKSTSVFY